MDIEDEQSNKDMNEKSQEMQEEQTNNSNAVLKNTSENTEADPKAPEKMQVESNGNTIETEKLSPEEILEQKKRAMQLEFKKIITQLQQGCGREKCFNSYCASNPSNLMIIEKYSINQIANLALNILQKSTDKYNNFTFCENTNIPPKSLQFSEIKALLDDAVKQDNYSQVKQRFKEAFSSVEALNLSFFLKEDVTLIPDSDHSYIDYLALSQFEKLILDLKDKDLQEQLLNIILSGFKSFLNYYRDNEEEFDKYFESADQIRVFIILLELPNMLEPQNLEFQIPIFYLVNKLPYYLIEDVMVNWFTQYPKNKIQQMITNLQTILSIKIVMSREDLDFEHYICNIVKFMKIIYDSNMKRIDQIPLETFHNEVITQVLSPQAELKVWYSNNKKNRQNFTFCDYPFIINVGFKQKIIEFEHKIMMEEQRQKDRQSEFESFDITNFFTQIHRAGYLFLEVRRNNLVQDTISQLGQQEVNLKRPLKIKFQGEIGQDEGGITKEYFQLIIEQIFNPDFGMVIPKNNNRVL